MGGKTSTESKTKYNAKTYDEIKVRVPKHEKERIQAFAALQGKSLNRFINDAIAKEMKAGVLKTKNCLLLYLYIGMWQGVIPTRNAYRCCL